MHVRACKRKDGLGGSISSKCVRCLCAMNRQEIGVHATISRHKITICSISPELSQLLSLHSVLLKPRMHSVCAKIEVGNQASPPKNPDTCKSFVFRRGELNSYAAAAGQDTPH